MNATSSPLPPRLCRFRTYGAAHAGGNDKREVFDLLAGRIRFSRLKDFNDPFEGRPCAVPAFSDAGGQRAAVLKFLSDFYRRTRGLSPTEARKLSETNLRRKTQQEVVDLIGEQVIQTASSDGLHICCLSDQTALSNPLPWSHYADRHRGVAIHFSTAHAPFSFAFPVIYSQTYPEVIVPRTHQDPWEHVERIFFTKSALWAYEHEFRIMRVEWTDPERDPRAISLRVEWNGATAVAPGDAVVGITIGAKMEERDRASLIACISTEFPHLEIWQGRLHRTRYEIASDRVR
jgi:Protein of unknown function (DUF2971)